MLAIQRFEAEIAGSAEVTDSAPTFVDVFAGCGGLSLGLARAGWRGLFAVEKDRFAFETLKANFLGDSSRYPFVWPQWLKKAPWSVEDLLREHRSELAMLRGKVDLLAGGPPCQGFSDAGRRRADDPRNELIGHYLSLVEILEPQIVFLENVRGFTYDFKSAASDSIPLNFSVLLRERLQERYRVFTSVLRAARFGVPQSRPRFFLIGFLKGSRIASGKSPFTILRAIRASFLTRKGIPERVSAKAAISDLEVQRNGKRACPDCKGYEAIAYKRPTTAFQAAMRDGHDGPPSDTRLAKHRPDITLRFEQIIARCKSEGRLNVSLSREVRGHFGLKKAATRVLDPRKPAPTVTSMPDDLLHYSEPRTLTVRENARLQTFPDWFVFKGKYTTGGDLRRREVPRFSQVANAVPPLLAEMFGSVLLAYVHQIRIQRPVLIRATRSAAHRRPSKEPCLYPEQPPRRSLRLGQLQQREPPSG